MLLSLSVDVQANPYPSWRCWRWPGCPSAWRQPAARPAARYPAPPQVLFKDLFVAVQTGGDLRGRQDIRGRGAAMRPPDILGAYHAARPQSPAELGLRRAHFRCPHEATTPRRRPSRSARAHIDRLWT